jgi:hypothetical protein
MTGTPWGWGRAARPIPLPLTPLFGTSGAFDLISSAPGVFLLKKNIRVIRKKKKKFSFFSRPTLSANDNAILALFASLCFSLRLCMRAKVQL